MRGVSCKITGKRHDTDISKQTLVYLGVTVTLIMRIENAIKNISDF